LSRSNIHQIVNRSKKEEKEQDQSKKLLAELRMLDDIDQNWPTETLIKGLRFSWRATRCLIRHFDCSEFREISLRNIMDFLITDYKEIPHDLSEACPAFKQKDVGRKTYGELINCLSEQDLGCAFGIEWNKRLHKFTCFMRRRWGTFRIRIVNDMKFKEQHLFFTGRQTTHASENAVRLRASTFAFEL
jgi:hypothetical protein